MSKQTQNKPDKRRKVRRRDSIDHFDAGGFAYRDGAPYELSIYKKLRLEFKCK